MNPDQVIFQKERSFSDVLNATFHFIKQEFNTLGKAILIYVGPFIVVTAILTALVQSKVQSSLFNVSVMGDLTNPFSSIFTTKYFLTIFFAFLTHNMMLTTVYSYIRVYNTKGKGNFELDDVWNEIQSNFFPLFGTLILSSLIGIIAMVFLIIPGIYIMVCLSIIFAIKVNEQTGFSSAFRRCFFLIKDQWWMTFAFLIIMYILVAFLSSIFLIPQTIFTFINVFHSISGDTVGEASLFFIIVSTIGTFLANLTYAIPYIAIGFHYFNLVEQKEHTSLLHKINEINESNML